VSRIYWTVSLKYPDSSSQVITRILPPSQHPGEYLVSENDWLSEAGRIALVAGPMGGGYGPVGPRPLEPGLDGFPRMEEIGSPLSENTPSRRLDE
jgi:hypothetical protein